MTSYRTLNEFLCAFINHALPRHSYSIRDRSSIEKFLNYEFQVFDPTATPGQIGNILFVGK